MISRSSVILDFHGCRCLLDSNPQILSVMLYTQLQRQLLFRALPVQPKIAAFFFYSPAHCSRRFARIQDYPNRAVNFSRRATQGNTNNANKTGAMSEQNMALRDIARQVTVFKGRLPLGKLLHTVMPKTREVILSAGRGVEAFFKILHKDKFDVIEAGGVKYVIVKDASLLSPVSAVDAQQLNGTAEGANAVFTVAEHTIADPRRVLDTAAQDEFRPAEVIDPEWLHKKLEKVMEDDCYYQPGVLYARVYKDLTFQRSAHKDSFEAFIDTNPHLYWTTTRDKKYVCRRRPEHGTNLPPFKIGGAAIRYTTHVLAPSVDWGGNANVPTAEDVRQVMKLIPRKWTALMNINIPKDIKKTHMRTKSQLRWLAKQPQYFDLRHRSGITQIRQSPMVCPEAYDMTPEAACLYVQERIDETRANSGEPQIMKEVRAYTMKQSIFLRAESSEKQGWKVQAQPIVASNLLEVCQYGYFCPSDIVFRGLEARYRLEDIFAAADHLCKNQIEYIQLECSDRIGAQYVFLRRLHEAADPLQSRRWKDDFANEFHHSKHPEVIVALMTRTCGEWDRLQFVFVLLPDFLQREAGGYQGMINILKAHPNIFQLSPDGQFLRRADFSTQPLQQTQVQKQSSGDRGALNKSGSESSDSQRNKASPDSASTCYVQGAPQKFYSDNPYRMSAFIIQVLHYLIPEGQSRDTRYLLQCCSPALKSQLHDIPRLIHTRYPNVLTFTSDNNKITRTSDSVAQLAVIRAKWEERCLEQTKLGAQSGLVLTGSSGHHR